jgi:hypothetical protein
MIGLLVAACGAPVGAERAASPAGAASRTPDDRAAGQVLEAYLHKAQAAWEAKDSARFAELYTQDARITEVGERERPLRELLDDMADGPLTLRFARGLIRDREAVVEWVYGGPHPARDRIATRGASVLSFSADGRVQREIRYLDASTLSAQIGAGFRYCLPHRPALPDSSAAPTLHVGTARDSDAAARAWSGAVAGSASASPSPLVSNLFLPADAPGVSGMAEPWARAFQASSATVARCVSSSDLIACEVERRGTFSAPLLGIKPTGRTGTTHWLDVAELHDGAITRVTAYGNGQEFVRSFVDLDSQGFLSPAQLVDPEACK